MQRPEDWPARARSSFFWSFSYPPSRYSIGIRHVLEHDLGRLRRADAELRLLLAHGQPGGVLGNHERRLAAMPELGVHGRDHDGHVGDPAVGDEDLGAVEHPLVAVQLGRGAQRADVGAGARLGDGVGAELDLVAHPEALGHPAPDLLGRARAGDAGRGERAALDRERDAGAAPVQLLGVDAAVDPVGVLPHPLDVVEPVEAPLACGLDGLPGHALLAVVLVRDRPDDLASEPAAGLLELELLVVEPEIHRRGASGHWLTDQSIVPPEAAERTSIGALAGPRLSPRP